jgi:molecular chaperone GrpE
VLEQEGVSAIDCSEGKVLDPSLHNAIATEERDDVPSCTITEQIRKGYAMKGRVIRPGIVKVSVKKSKNQDNKLEEKLNE